MSEPEEYVRVTKKKIGKFNVTLYVLNEPSEEAMMNCRKTVTRIMNERIRDGKPI